MVACSLRKSVMGRRAVSACPALCFLLLAWAGSVPSAEFQETPRADFWVPDGPVHAVVEANGVVFMGGSFSSLQRWRGSGVALSLDQWEADPSFPDVRGVVYAVVPDGSGGFYLGGDFNEVGGVPVFNLAHITAEHVVNPGWNPRPDGPVTALARAGRTVYAAGLFTEVDGFTRSGLAAVDAPSGAVTDWNPAFDPQGVVLALAIYRNTLVVGGAFASAGGASRSGLAALDFNTALANGWNPAPAGGRVRALAVRGDTVYVGGNFRTMGAEARHAAAAVDAIDGSVLPWNPVMSPTAVSSINALAATETAVYLGGQFTSMGGAARSSLAAVDPVNAALLDWAPPLAGGRTVSVDALAISGGIVFVGGQFTSVGDLSRDGFAALSLDTGAALEWAVPTTGGANALAVSFRTVFAAGPILTNPSVTRANLAAVDSRTGQPLDWWADTDGPVHALAVAHDRLYIGGTFSDVGGLSRQNLAAVEQGNGNTVKTWAPNPDGTVLALAASDTVVYAGGQFTTLAGVSIPHLAAFSRTNAFVLPWFPRPDGPVRALVLDRSTVYAGGDFSNLGTIPRPHLAAVEADGSVRDWNPGADGPVFALLAYRNQLYVGGSFSELGGADRASIGAVGLDQGALHEFDPRADGSVFALANGAGHVYAGGSYTAIGGRSHAGLAQLDSESGSAADWQPSVAGAVLALSSSGGVLTAGHAVVARDPGPRPGLSVFAAENAPFIVKHPADVMLFPGDDLRLSVVAVGDEPLSYQWLFNGENLGAADAPELVMENLDVDFNGRFSVNISNPFGQVASREAYVTLLEMPVVVFQPRSVTVDLGEDAVLAMQATGNPSPVYRWTKNGLDIPGASGPILLLGDISPEDGGAYQVFVSNPAGTVASDVVDVNLNLPLGSFSDDMSRPGPLDETVVFVRGNNRLATSEPGEPDHAGLPGGKSMWTNWRVPEDGVAVIDTRGSQFDTLLGVYRLNNEGELVEVAGSDDQGGFGTSRVMFNAEAGMEYLVAVDGFLGASGDFVLNMVLHSGFFPIPEIFDFPECESAMEGSNATLYVEADSAMPLTYQWYHEGNRIPGATGSALPLDNVRLSDVGTYLVEVDNGSEAGPVFLEIVFQIGPLGGPLWEGKPTKVKSITLGVDSQAAFGFAASKAYTPSLSLAPCQSVLSNPHSLTNLTATIPGTFILDTAGTEFRSVVSVFTGLPPNHTVVHCVVTNAPNAFDCRLKFDAQPNVDYNIAVGAVNAIADGNDFCQVTISFCGVPVVKSAPTSTFDPIVYHEDEVVFSVEPISAFCEPQYQWLRNGSPIPGASQPSLTNALPLVAGDSYSIIVSSCGGTVTNHFATLLELWVERLGSGTSANYRLRGQPVVSDAYVVESAVKTFDWAPFYTNPPNVMLDVPVFPAPSTETNRFFRVWPMTE